MTIYVRSFHWILIIIEPDRSHAYVTIFDSLRKPPAEYQEIQDMLNL